MEVTFFNSMSTLVAISLFCGHLRLPTYCFSKNENQVYFGLIFVKHSEGI
jgi:hypothetical protein